MANQKTLAVQVRDLKGVLDALRCAVGVEPAQTREERLECWNRARIFATVPTIKSLAQRLDTLAVAFRDRSAVSLVEDTLKAERLDHISTEPELEEVNDLLEREGWELLHGNNDDELKEVLDDNEVSRLELLKGYYDKPYGDYFYFENDQFYGVSDLEEFLEDNFPDEWKEMKEERLEDYSEDDLQDSSDWGLIANALLLDLSELCEDVLPSMLAAERSSANEHDSPEAEKAPESLADEFPEEQDN